MRMPQPESEFLAYMKRVVAADGAELLSDAEIARSPDGTPLLNGFFPAAKNADEDRGITDRRPSNLFERALAQPRLPHGSQWSQVVLDQASSMRFSKKDLPDFFPSLRVSPEKTKRNVVGQRFDVETLRAWGFEIPARHLHETGLYFGLSTLTMGDRNALAHATAGHEAIGRSVGQLLPGQVMRYGLPLPRGALLQGVYVDDWMAGAKLPHATIAAGEDGPDQAASSAMKDATVLPPTTISWPLCTR